MRVGVADRDPRVAPDNRVADKQRNGRYVAVRNSVAAIPRHGDVGQRGGASGPRNRAVARSRFVAGDEHVGQRHSTFRPENTSALLRLVPGDHRTGQRCAVSAAAVVQAAAESRGEIVVDGEIGEPHGGADQNVYTPAVAGGYRTDNGSAIHVSSDSGVGVASGDGEPVEHDRPLYHVVLDGGNLRRNHNVIDAVRRPVQHRATELGVSLAARLDGGMRRGGSVRREPAVNLHAANQRERPVANRRWITVAILFRRLVLGRVVALGHPYRADGVGGGGDGFTPSLQFGEIERVGETVAGVVPRRAVARTACALLDVNRTGGVGLDGEPEQLKLVGADVYDGDGEKRIPDETRIPGGVALSGEIGNAARREIRRIVALVDERTRDAQAIVARSGRRPIGCGWIDRSDESGIGIRIIAESLVARQLHALQHAADVLRDNRAAHRNPAVAPDNRVIDLHLRPGSTRNPVAAIPRHGDVSQSCRVT